MKIKGVTVERLNADKCLDVALINMMTWTHHILPLMN